MGDICCKYKVLVVSDEIHQDFVFKGKHQVFAALKKEYETISITCTSPSKTFNLAGLPVSNIFIPDSGLRRSFQKELDRAGSSQLGVMGLTACEAAYQYGETWYQAMLAYIKENIDFTRAFIEKELPSVQMIDLEGTYLAWLDFRKTGLNENELEEFIIRKARLWLDSGKIFGECGSGFQRINTACPRCVLEEALNRIKELPV